MVDVAGNVARMRAQLRRYPQARLIAVSKTFDATAVRAAADAGIRDFGENYLQEAQTKIAACADLRLVWHFIGGLQSRKAAAVARHFDWVHSVDRLSIAEKLSTARGEVMQEQPPKLPPAPAEASQPPDFSRGVQNPHYAGALNVLMQVNVDDEAGKSGVAMGDAAALARAVAALPNLRLRGLMAIPAATDDAARQRRAFDKLAALRADLISGGLSLDCLSMGMSGDFEQALAAGATHIRIGSAIFGARERRQ